MKKLCILLVLAAMPLLNSCEERDGDCEASAIDINTVVEEVVTASTVYLA